MCDLGGATSSCKPNCACTEDTHSGMAFELIHSNDVNMQMAGFSYLPQTEFLGRLMRKYIID